MLLGSPGPVRSPMWRRIKVSRFSTSWALGLNQHTTWYRESLWRTSPQLTSSSWCHVEQRQSSTSRCPSHIARGAKATLRFRVNCLHAGIRETYTVLGALGLKSGRWLCESREMREKPPSIFSASCSKGASLRRWSKTMGKDPVFVSQPQEFLQRPTFQILQKCPSSSPSFKQNPGKKVWTK